MNVYISDACMWQLVNPLLYQTLTQVYIYLLNILQLPSGERSYMYTVLFMAVIPVNNKNHQYLYAKFIVKIIVSIDTSCIN